MVPLPVKETATRQATAMVTKSVGADVRGYTAVTFDVSSKKLINGWQMGSGSSDSSEAPVFQEIEDKAAEALAAYGLKVLRAHEKLRSSFGLADEIELVRGNFGVHNEVLVYVSRGLCICVLVDKS